MSLLALIDGGLVGLALLLMQRFLAYFGLALLGPNVSAWVAAGMALTLYASAVLTEIWRGCVMAITKGQWEAADSLALSFTEQMRHGVGPQALRNAVPATVGVLVQVIKGIDLTLRPGEELAIIDKSGSGKSTLLRCVNGLKTFQHGALQVDGQALKHGDAKAMRALRQHGGMIFQSFNLFPHLSVGKNVRLAPRLVKQTDRAAATAQARQLLVRVGLGEKFDAWPDQFLGGQQQRVAIARALPMQPSVMLCDEITSALDPELVGEVLRVLDTPAEQGMTLLMVTREMNFARKVADRIVFMHAGRIHEMGPPAATFGDPQTAQLKRFLSALH